MVTGGTGLVGSAIREAIEAENNAEEKWVYLSSKDGDLTDPADTAKIFDNTSPHASPRRAGGRPVREHETQGSVLEEQRRDERQHLPGVPQARRAKLVSYFPPIFPDKTTFPIDEKMIHDGPPLLQRGLRLRQAHGRRAEPHYKSQYRCNFAVIPNIFGKHDNFHLEDSRVPGLIHRGTNCLKEGKDFEIWARNASASVHLLHRPGEAMIRTLRSYEEADPHLSVGEEDEISISDVAYAVAKAIGMPKEQVKFDTSKADGQFKKTATTRSSAIPPRLPFTPFEEAMDTP